METITDEMIADTLTASGNAAALARELDRFNAAQVKSLPSGPVPEAIECYRGAIYAAGENGGSEDADPTILQDAWKLTIDWQRDLKRYKQRLTARKMLDEYVPQLQAELRELQVKAAATPQAGDRRVSDFATVKELTEAIQRHITKIIPLEQIAVRQKKEDLENVIYNNNQILQQTFDPALLENEKRLSEQINSLVGAIASREKILKIDDEVARCRRRCEKLARGERIDGMGWGVGSGGMIPVERSNLPPVADLYKIERRKLAILLSQAGGGLKEKAIEDNARDEAKLPALQAQLAELRKLRLDPRNMKWEK